MHIVFIQFYKQPTPSYPLITKALRDRGNVVGLGTRNPSGDIEFHDGQKTIAVVPQAAKLPEAFSQIPVLSALIQRLLTIPFLFRLSKFLRNHPTDIAQVNPSSQYFFGLLTLLERGKSKFIIDFRQIRLRGEMTIFGKISDWVNYRMNQFIVKRIFHHSCFLHSLGAEKTLGRDWQRWAKVVPLGVHPSFLSLPRTLSDLRQNHKPVKFVYIGTLAKVRNLELLLLAIKKMLDRSNNFHVTFIGPDRANGYYQEFAKRLNLTSHVEFEPPHEYEQLPKIISRFDVALGFTPDIPIYWQYQPTLKALEYKALGMAVLATNNAPNREIVKHESTGLLVENSMEGLCEGMLRFVLDGDFLYQCQMNASKNRGGLSWDQVAEMYEQEVYIQLLQNA